MRAVQSPGMTASARFIAGAALVGLLLRLGFGLWYWVDKPLMKDEVLSTLHSDEL